MIFKKLSRIDESTIGNNIPDKCETRKMTEEDYNKYGLPTINKDQLSKKRNCISSDVLNVQKNYE